MDKKLTLAVVLMMCLAGCMRSVDDNIEIPWCDDDPDLKGIVNSSNSEQGSELCTTKDTLENAIVDFIDLMENGPSENITSPVGYSMSVSEVSEDGQVWTYLETTVIGPNGFKLTIEDNYGNDTQILDFISEGTQVQISYILNGESTQVRMNNTNSHEKIIDSVFGFDDDENDRTSNINCHSTCGECDDTGKADCLTCSDPDTILMDEDNDGAGMCVMAPDTYWADQAFQLKGSQEHYDRVMNVSLEKRQTEYLNLRDEIGMDDPVTEDYTEYYNPLTVEITGFKETDSGMMFPGIISYEGSPYGELEIYADMSFSITGFSMKDVNDDRNFVTFNLISGGETIVDMSLNQDALPFILEETIIDEYKYMGMLSVAMFDIDGDSKVTSLEMYYYTCILGGFTITECQETDLDNDTLAIYQINIDSIDLNMDGFADESEFSRNSQVIQYVSENGGCMENAGTFYRYNLSITEADCTDETSSWFPAEEVEREEFTGYWVEYEDTNWSCNWVIETEDDYTYTYWDCQYIRDPPQDTGDNEWHYCEYYEDIESHYCTNGFGNDGTDDDGERSNSATFTHWRDGTDPRYDNLPEESQNQILAYEIRSIIPGVEGDMNDYNLTLANCTGEFTDANGSFNMRVCQPDSTSASLQFWIDNEVLLFSDTDNSGTISNGDIFSFDESFSDLEDSNQFRLYSIEAGKYCDQNPLMSDSF